MQRHLAAESKSSVLRRFFQTLIYREIQLIGDTMAELSVLKALTDLKKKKTKTFTVTRIANNNDLLRL